MDNKKLRSRVMKIVMLILEDATADGEFEFSGSPKQTAKMIELVKKKVLETRDLIANEKSLASYSFDSPKTEYEGNWKDSIKDDSIKCLICGKTFKSLTKHLRAKHNIEPSEYKKEFGIPAEIALCCKDFSELKRQRAIANKLGNKSKE